MGLANLLLVAAAVAGGRGDARSAREFYEDTFLLVNESSSGPSHKLARSQSVLMPAQDVQLSSRQVGALTEAPEKTMLLPNQHIFGRDGRPLDMSVLSDCLQSIDLNTWTYQDSTAQDFTLKKANHSHIILVARYDEDLEWINTDLLDVHDWIDNVLVLNKGPDPVSTQFRKGKVRVRNMPNLGREGDSFMAYVESEYDFLPELVFFFQGDPSPHVQNMSSLLSTVVINSLYNKTFQPLTKSFAEYARIPDVLMVHEEMQLMDEVIQLWVSASTLQVIFRDGTAEDSHRAKDQGVYGFKQIWDPMAHELGLSPSTTANIVRELCKTLEFNQCPDLQSNSYRTVIPYTMSAMFEVSGDALRAYPRSFYRNVRKWLIYDDSSGVESLAKASNDLNDCLYLRQAGRRGYFLERLWQYMFTGSEKMLSTHAIYDRSPLPQPSSTSG